jgi:neutral ceramidase
MQALVVGHGRECITPPLGIRMMGYASRTDGAADVHDDLYVNAVALCAGGASALLLAYDVCLFDPELATEIRKAAAEAVALPVEAVFVNTSHTHAGPAVGGRYGDAENPDYRQSIIARGAAAAEAAMDDMRPAGFAVGHAPVDIGCNRRERRPDGEVILGHNPEGPTRHEMSVWRFTREGGPDVVLFSTPMHGTVLGGGNLRISAEWMGAAASFIEAGMDGTRAVFLQGCGADQDPYYTMTNGIRGTFEEVEEAGRKAADAVAEALASARELNAQPMKLASSGVDLPGKEDAAETRRLALHGLRLGDAVLVALSCEAFVEYDLFGRSESPAEEILVLGYTDGNIGYLCTADVFAEGGYEPRTTRVAPQSEQMAKDAMRAMLQELAA